MKSLHYEPFELRGFLGVAKRRSAFHTKGQERKRKRPSMSSQSHLILSTMKNEASFILEWIAYHRVIGFTDFLVYTNDCDDCTVEILLRLQELGMVTHEANEVLRRGPHKSALKAAKSHPLTLAADWIFISDIDEFLVVKVGDGTVEALLEHVPSDAEVVPVTWRLFSHNDQIEFQDKLVIEQFTDAEKSLENGGFRNRFVKSLFRRQNELELFGLHGPKNATDYVWRQPDGRKLGSDDNLTRPESSFAYDIAQVNHYAVGSVDNYLVKRDRGRANHWKQTLGTDYWRKMCRGGETDLSIHQWLDAAKAEMNRLLEDDILRSLHEKAVTWRRDRIATLRGQSAFETMRNSILDLSKARDHHRRSDSNPEPVATDVPDNFSDQDIVLRRLEALCKEMRSLAEHLTPHDNAELTHDRLDDIERGLFGRVTTE